jgi:Mn-containing catalase
MVFFYHKELAYTVRVDNPSPWYATMLQQALGGQEGEIRVMLQYMFQGFGFRGPGKYKDMLLNVGTEEIGHVELLATAIAMNLEKAPTDLQDTMVNANPLIAAAMGGSLPRHVLSSGMSAMPVDSHGVPFNGGHVVASNNLVADMYANVYAESTGRLLATRLWEITDDPGMKDLLSFLIARDTMHQNQWLSVIEELEAPLPVPSDFPQSQEKQEVSYQFFVHSDAPLPPNARWTTGPSPDGKGQFSVRTDVTLSGGQIPVLEMAPPQAHGLVMQKPDFVAPNESDPLPPATGGDTGGGIPGAGAVRKIVDKVTGDS